MTQDWDDLLLQTMRCRHFSGPGSLLKMPCSESSCSFMMEEILHQLREMKPLNLKPLKILYPSVWYSLVYPQGWCYLEWVPTIQIGVGTRGHRGSRATVFSEQKGMLEESLATRKFTPRVSVQAWNQNGWNSDPEKMDLAMYRNICCIVLYYMILY